VSALFDMLAGVVGPEKLVLRAGKVNALKMMRSANLPDRLCALQRLVFEDPTRDRVHSRAEQRKAIAGRRGSDGGPNGPKERRRRDRAEDRR